MKASDNLFPKVLFAEGESQPTPPNGVLVIYAKDDGRLYSKNSIGFEVDLGGGGGGGGAGYTWINLQSGASYTLVLADAGALVTMSSADANSITIPPDSAVAFPVGTRVDVGQDGAGQTSIAAGFGVSIRTPETLKLRKQWAKATIIKRATDEWDLEGNLEAAP